MLIVYGWLHLNKVWQSTDRMLKAVVLLPLQARSRLPLAVTSLFGHYLASRKPRSRDIQTYQLHQRQVLAAKYEHLAAALNIELGLTAEERTGLKAALAKTNPTTLTTTAQACLLVLQHVNNNPGLAEQYLSKIPDESKTSSDQKPRIHLWLMHAQEFVAVEVMVYLSQFFVQMRNLAVSLSCLPSHADRGVLVSLSAAASLAPSRTWCLLSWWCC